MKCKERKRKKKENNVKRVKHDRGKSIIHASMKILRGSTQTSSLAQIKSMHL